MPLVARRKVRQSWREAVLARAAECGVESEATLRFDALVTAGEPEAAAAFTTLHELDCLVEIDLPGYPVPPLPT